MANVPVRRMQEMEEEMNRFEEEILSTVDDGPHHHFPPRQMIPGPMMNHPLVVPPPPPPPQSLGITRPFTMNPSFIPPQLRARQMMLPPRPPMHLRPIHPHIPGSFQPPPPPPGGPMMNQVPPPNSFNFNSNKNFEETQYNPKMTAAPMIIAASKVIYSAPPVKNSSDKKTTDATNNQTVTISTTITATITSAVTTATSNATSGSSGSGSERKDSHSGKKKESDDHAGPSAKVAKVESLVKPPINSSKITVNLQTRDIDGAKNSSSASSSSSSSAPRPTFKPSTSFTPVKTTPTPSTGSSAPSTSASKTSSSGSKDKKDKKEKKKRFIRMAAGSVWEDLSLNEWDPDDFRLFCGDLGNEVTDDVLNRVFAKYPSFQKARVIRDKRSNKTKGYGFASFKDPTDFMKAIRDLNGKYVGNRPIKLKKSCWQDRQIENMKKKEREKKRLGFR